MSILKVAEDRASDTTRTTTLQYRSKRSSERVPFVVTYNPNNPPLRAWLNTHQTLLHTSDRMARAVPEVPILGERNARSLRSILMPTILPTTTSPEEAGSSTCEKNCVLCREHLVNATHFASDVTGETFTIRDRLSCSSQNVIYLMYCAKCKGAQYVGETVNTLKIRFALHRSHIKQNTGTHVTTHYNTAPHTRQDMRVVPIEQVRVTSTTVRQRRERFWAHKLRTIWPEGLNAPFKEDVRF